MRTESQPPTIEEQQRFWDWHWRSSDERKTVNEWKARRHDVLLSLIRSLPFDRPRILDLGCGHGWFAAKLAGFAEVSGIDLSEEGIRIARLRSPHIEFIAGNLYDHPLPKGHYDVVVSQEVIDHVEDQVAFVDRAADVLRPGGYFVVSCANMFVMDRLGPDEFPQERPEHIEYYLDLAGLRRLLSPRFRLLQARSILPIAGRRGILRLVHSHKLNAALALVVPRRHIDRLKEHAGFGYQLVALAQKP